MYRYRESECKRRRHRHKRLRQTDRREVRVLRERQHPCPEQRESKDGTGRKRGKEESETTRNGQKGAAGVGGEERC